ncbi:PBP1A family penicillin-binding protein [Gemmatimonas sp.]|uniref:transglycosylase domain-containing protein n=1 Tax=Gemmatimonas sp. TaxID=1962908 RepID=UPI00286D2D89|nr:PBP1A family penicillin-binding protein [Gemmatimonas sp.]
MEAEVNNTPASAATPAATPAVSWRTRLFKPLLYAGALAVAGALTTASWWWSCGWQGCPTPAQLRAWKPTEGGALLARDSAFVSALSPVNRTNVPLSRVPAQVQAAFIAVEDRRFHAHHGVDWYGVGRATVANLTAGSVREGASTITMQLARNVFLGNRATERTFGRKLLEWRYATLLEASLSKQDILERYLNAIYLGNGVYGVEGASRDLFGKSVKDISLTEAAMLAGLPKAPSSYSPRRDKSRALARRAVVFDVLLREGVADSATIQAVRNKPLKLARAEWAPARAVDSWAVEAVRVTLDSLRKAGVIPKALNDAQLRVWSTIDRRAQIAGERVIAAGAWQIDQERAYGGFSARGAGSRTQGALVALDPTTGAVRAVVGGRRIERKGFNRALRAKRQPGSTFKPFVYAEALRQGFTAASMLEDEPVEIDIGRTMWTPANYGDEYAGHITMRDALARSANAATVRLSSKLSVQRIADLAHAQGIVSELPIVPALALGAGAVTPLELTAAYAPFGNGGTRVNPYLVERVEDQFGRVIWSHPRTAGAKVLEATDAFLITSLLQGVVDRGTGRPVRDAGIRGPVAGKTGTTNDGTDVWFVGYTPTLVASVWFGADDPQPLGWNASGGRLAAPVWARFLRDGWHSPEDDSTWVPPAGIETKQIDIGTGKLASDWCGPSRREFFVRGSAPKESCENDPYLAMRDAEPPDWHESNGGGPGEIDPAQIAEAVSGVLEAVGGNAKARAAADRIMLELRKVQRDAAREARREAERARREMQAMPEPPVPPRPPRGRD